MEEFKMGRRKKIIDIQGITASKPTYHNTREGAAYYANMLLDNEIIGNIENSGTGGSTDIRIINFDKIEEFYEKVKLYFNYTIGFKTEGISRHSLDYTFAEHLLDMKENGYVRNETLKLGWLV
jgi:hypothetical protein